MTLVTINRETFAPLAGAIAICLVVAMSGEAQYRTRGSCACNDCTASGDWAGAPMVPGQVQPQVPAPGQPQVPEPGVPQVPTPEQAQPQAQDFPTPGLAEEQFASLGSDTISLAQNSPNMIGDFFASGCSMATLILEESSTRPNQSPLEVELCIPTPGSSIGRVKLADNNSPWPRDRVFFDYNYFHNTNLNGIDVHRYTPGLEKTFFDGNMSLEFRMPMASTLDNDVVIDDVTGVVGTETNGEFGDLFFGLKALLLASDRGAIAAGVGVSVPTANDVRINLVDGTQLVLIENEAVYISPYAAFVVTPSPDSFFQCFVQFNFDANGNPVIVNQFDDGLVTIGRFNEQSSVYLDLSFGRWIFRDFSRGPRGLAWVFEAHYSSAIQDADSINSEFFQLGDPDFDFDVVNLTLGAHAVVGQTVFTIGWGVPVTDDQVFDGELRAFVNRYF
jgi:hypothetical protein